MTIMVIVVINHGFLNGVLEFYVKNSPMQSFLPTTLEEGTKTHCDYNTMSTYEYCSFNGDDII